MKIAHFISTSGMYGAERWVLALMNHMEKDQTLLLCSNHDNSAILEEAKKYSLNTQLLKVKGNFHMPSFINALVTAIQKHNIDILHTHGYKTDILGFWAAKKTGTLCISTPHGWDNSGGYKLLLYQILDQLILRFFEMVAPLSNDLAHSLKWVRKENIRMIKNFTDLTTFPPWKIGDPKFITFIGQLIPRKRVQDLIEAINLVRDKEVHLQIIGDGPEREKLKKLCLDLGLQDRIKFYGFRDDRLDLLNNSSIFILPSLLEGIPRAMMEAMGMGKLALGSNIPGTADLITHKKTGLLFPPKNPQAIAKAIDFVMENKGLAETIRQNGKNLIETEYSAERAAMEYVKLYREILKRKPPSQPFK